MSLANKSRFKAERPTDFNNCAQSWVALPSLDIHQNTRRDVEELLAYSDCAPTILRIRLVASPMETLPAITSRFNSNYSSVAMSGCGTFIVVSHYHA